MKSFLATLSVCLLINLIAAQAQSNKVLSDEEEKDVLSALTKRELANADSTWKFGGTVGVNFSQVYLSNWAAGGLNSISVGGLLSTYANHAKGKIAWDNTLDLAYGMLWQGDRAGIKSDDRIDFASKLGYQASEAWFYSAMLNFRTQFDVGLADPYAEDPVVISNFMAPGYLLAALGMDYKPSENFTIFISPATLKSTYVLDQDLADAGAFGVEPAEFDTVGNVVTITHSSGYRQELGGFLKMMYKTALGENVTFQTKVDLFSNYQNNPQNIDVNWENLLTLKVNDYISTTISTQLIYDDDIDIARDEEYIEETGILAGPATQFKEVLAVGLSYKF